MATNLANGPNFIGSVVKLQTRLFLDLVLSHDSISVMMCLLTFRYFLDILRDYNTIDSGIVLAVGATGSSLIPGYTIGERR